MPVCYDTDTFISKILSFMSSKILKQLKQYKNQWVVLTLPDEEIVGSGKDVAEAQANAEKHGYTDPTQITFFKVLPFGHYIPAFYVA